MRWIALNFLLISPAALLSALGKGRFEQNIAFSMLASALLLYLFGVLGMLLPGFYILCALMCACGVAAAVIFIRKRDRIVPQLLTPGFAAFTLLYALLYALLRDSLLHVGDEFSHWGLVVKNMYLLNQLGDSPASSVVFRTYPNLMGVLQYFFVRIVGWREDALFVGYYTLLYAMPLIALRRVQWKQWLAIPFYVLVVTLLGTLFYANSFLNTIIIDPVLGAALGYALLALHDRDAAEPLSYVRLAAGLAALPLIKQAGWGLSALLLLLMAADWLICGQGAGVLRLRAAAKKYRWAVAGGTALLVAGLITAGVLAFPGISAGFDNAAILDTFPWSYLLAIFTRQLGEGASMWNLVQFLCVFCAAGVLVARMGADAPQRRRLAVFAGGTALLAALYAVGLLFTYLTRFSQYEATSFASYARYLNVPLLGGFLFLLLQAVRWFEQPRGRYAAGLCLIVLALGFFTPNVKLVKNLWDEQAKQEIREDRREHAIAADYINKHTKSTDKVRIIVQHTANFDMLELHYELAPRYANFDRTWSIGTPYSGKDLWTASFTPEQWQKYLLDNGYQYVYLYKTDDKFWKLFGSLFDDRQGSYLLYRVEKTGDGICALKRVPD